MEKFWKERSSIEIIMKPVGGHDLRICCNRGPNAFPRFLSILAGLEFFAGMSSTEQPFSKSSSTSSSIPSVQHDIERRPISSGTLTSFQFSNLFLSSSCACRFQHETRFLTSLRELLPLFYTPRHQELLSMAIIINGKISLNISITDLALPWCHLR